jgi:hypothetical protein
MSPWIDQLVRERRHRGRPPEPRTAGGDGDRQPVRAGRSGRRRRRGAGHPWRAAALVEPATGGGLGGAASRCCSAWATPGSYSGFAGCSRTARAWSWPPPSRRCAAGSRDSSTGASTGAATTPPRRSSVQRPPARPGRPGRAARGAAGRGRPDDAADPGLAVAAPGALTVCGGGSGCRGHRLCSGSAPSRARPPSRCSRHRPAEVKGTSSSRDAFLGAQVECPLAGRRERESRRRRVWRSTT